MVTKLQLYNGALSHIGTTRLADLTVNEGPRYELDAVYDHCLQFMLEQGLWKFAKRTARLEPDADYEPDFGPAYAYTMPTDFVRLAGIATDEYFRSELLDYREENGVWYTDSSLIYVSWISNGAEFGLDLGLYPSNYVESLQAYMAFKTTLQISKDRGDRNTIYQYFQRFLAQSRRLDAVDEAVKWKPAGSWGQSRGGSPCVNFRNGRMSIR